MISPIIRQLRERATPFGTKSIASLPISAHFPGICDFWIKKSRSHQLRGHANHTQSTAGQQLTTSRLRTTQNPKFKNSRAPHIYGIRDLKTWSETSSLAFASPPNSPLHTPPSPSSMLRLFPPTQLPIIKRFTAVRTREPRLAIRVCPRFGNPHSPFHTSQLRLTRGDCL
jgi:hypothetical protein